MTDHDTRLFSQAEEEFYGVEPKHKAPYVTDCRHCLRRAAEATDMEGKRIGKAWCNNIEEYVSLDMQFMSDDCDYYWDNGDIHE